MAAEIPCTVLNPINCYRDNFHTSNTNLMAVCENNISVIRIETNLYLFLSCEITVSSSAENILHMTGMQSHVTIPCTSLCTLHFPNSVVKENKYSVLYTQNATLTRIIEKPFSRRERNFFYSGSKCPWRRLQWVKRWEEPSGTLLQTHIDENIEDQDTTRAQRQTSWYTLSTTMRLPEFYVFLVN